ncbi:MAG TPA: M14 family zinc carboxypeptidase, partial [Ignavibacteria bacterium]|nr:M14 family zinc carboxypeptidase [Ignavibacteria bacterium]
MKKILLISAIFILIVSAASHAQDLKSYTEQKVSIENTFKADGEIYFMFHVFDRYSLNQFSNIISIDKAVNNGIGFDVYAYANSKELNNFLSFNYKFALLTSPGRLTEGVKTSSDIKEVMGQWDVYPTYDAYVALMNQFAATYPDICRIVDAGTTVQGRHLLFAVISDSVNYKKIRPQFMYTSSIHGDETAGYMFMLRLIDTLCESYNTVPAFNYLLKNVEIWINPLANPDGTYHGGNSTV